MADSYKGVGTINLDDVAYLFVEQYENLHGLYTEEYRKPEVDLMSPRYKGTDHSATGFLHQSVSASD